MFDPRFLRLFTGLSVIIALFSLATCTTEKMTPELTDPPPTVVRGLSTVVSPAETPSLQPQVSTQRSTPQIESQVAAPAALVPTPTLLPTPTATIPGMIGPDYFEEGVNPLTGMVVSDPDILNRRPIAIKISNSARVRPQAGLNKADLVYEHLTEGGITRFTAIFYSQDAAKVGSVRSGRLIDLEIPIMYDAAFAYSGSSAPLRLMFQDSLFFERIISPDFGHGGFGRYDITTVPGGRFEDNLFTNTYTLRSILEERGIEQPPKPENGMSFHPDPPESGIPVNTLEIIYPATGVYWGYSPSLGGYLRWSDGVAHVDGSSGEQLLFQNIVLVEAEHVNTEIIEDSGGSPSIQIRIWREGPVTVYRDGLRFPGLWHRLDSRQMLTFYDLEGNVIPLKPGKTFFEIVPLDFGPVFESP